MRIRRLFLVLAGILYVTTAALAQNNALPRLAVVEFTVANDAAQKTKRDAITIRDQVRSDIVKTSRYEVIARAEIDKLLADQRIQLSALTSSENNKASSP
ncbi:hypothetical protein AGMMS49944_23360 [Spirochaetia bacterium]|nr:hypothetical protein AGMMS49944_23360 [Spirochaetia bacterium]